MLKLLRVELKGDDDDKPDEADEMGTRLVLPSGPTTAIRNMVMLPLLPLTMVPFMRGAAFACRVLLSIAFCCWCCCCCCNDGLKQLVLVLVLNKNGNCCCCCPIEGELVIALDDDAVVFCGELDAN